MSARQVIHRICSFFWSSTIMFIPFLTLLEHSPKVVIDIIEKRLKYRNSRRFSGTCCLYSTRFHTKIFRIVGGRCTLLIQSIKQHPLPFRIEKRGSQIAQFEIFRGFFARFNTIVRHEIGRYRHIPTSLNLQLLGQDRVAPGIAPPRLLQIRTCDD